MKMKKYIWGVVVASFFIALQDRPRPELFYLPALLLLLVIIALQRRRLAAKPV